MSFDQNENQANSFLKNSLVRLNGDQLDIFNDSGLNEPDLS